MKKIYSWPRRQFSAICEQEANESFEQNVVISQNFRGATVLLFTTFSILKKFLMQLYCPENLRDYFNNWYSYLKLNKKRSKMMHHEKYF